MVGSDFFVEIIEKRIFIKGLILDFHHNRSQAPNKIFKALGFPVENYLLIRLLGQVEKPLDVQIALFQYLFVQQVTEASGFIVFSHLP